jgi:hypothetical protein
VTLDHGDGLGVADVEIEGLLHEEVARDAGHEQQDRRRRPALQVDAVSREHVGELLDLHASELA